MTTPMTQEQPVAVDPAVEARIRQIVMEHVEKMKHETFAAFRRMQLNAPGRDGR